MSRVVMNVPALAAIATAVCALNAAPASAAVIALQAPVDGGSAFESAVSVGLQNGDTFLTSSNGSITGLEWWGTQVTNTSAFYIRLFDTLSANATPVFECDDGTNATACGAPVVATSTALTDDVENPIDKFAIDFAAPIAIAGGNYLLSIGYETDAWFWLQGAGGDGAGYFRNADDQDWVSDGPDLSFSVIGTLDTSPGTVPEPGALALLGLAGLAGLLARARRPRS